MCESSVCLQQIHSQGGKFVNVMIATVKTEKQTDVRWKAVTLQFVSNSRMFLEVYPPRNLQPSVSVCCPVSFLHLLWHIIIGSSRNRRI